MPRAPSRRSTPPSPWSPATAAADAVGQSPAFLASGRHPPAFFSALRSALEETDRWRGDIWNRRKDGSIFVRHLTITCVRHTAGAPWHYVGIYTEPTADSDAMERIWINAQHGPLTGLPNRALLRDRIKFALLQAQRDASLVAALFLDVDAFKRINDHFGHAVGEGSVGFSRGPTSLADNQPG